MRKCCGSLQAEAEQHVEESHIKGTAADPDCSGMRIVCSVLGAIQAFTVF